MIIYFFTMYIKTFFPKSQLVGVLTPRPLWLRHCSFKFFVIKPYSFTPVHCFPNRRDSGDNSWLNVQLWPEDDGERLLYSDQEVAFFAKLTGLNTVDVLIDFRDYKLTKRSIL